MARPQKTLTDEEIENVEKLASVLSQEQLAWFLGIAPATFRAIVRRDERVSVAYKRGRANAIASAANQLLKKVTAGNLTAIIFYLKTQAGWRETGVIEHQYPEWLEQIMAMTPEELEALEAMDDEDVIRIFDKDEDGEHRRVG